MLLLSAFNWAWDLVTIFLLVSLIQLAVYFGLGGAIGLPQEKWSRSYGWFRLCACSNSAGDKYPREECRRTRL
jgi:hypothetical protein